LKILGRLYLEPVIHCQSSCGTRPIKDTAKFIKERQCTIQPETQVIHLGDLAGEELPVQGALVRDSVVKLQSLQGKRNRFRQVDGT
jgi:hypothetical protein